MFVKYPPKMISVVIFPFATYNGYDSTDTVYDDIDSLYDFIVGKILNEKYSEQFVERINSQLTQIEEQYGITLDEHKKILKEKYNSYFQ